jgi:7-cyano-7-deazaguanine synthase in queuosine biosynthesis
MIEKLMNGFSTEKDTEILKKEKKSFSWFELEPLPFSKALQEVSGVTDSIIMGRSVEKNFAPILELVAKGAPNGHVPITATYLFSAAFAAKAHGIADVVLSLERSAEEGNVEYLGLMINHQYSKSLEFERLAAAYVKEYIDPGMRVFSLLRPLYELQIVREFARHPQYFSKFVSCNRGLKTCSWCGECAKCAFMFAALSAFLPSATVEGIFKKNLFEDEALLPLYTELIGRGAQKPFDCVGTYDENLLALYLSSKQYEQEGRSLPVVLTALPTEEGAQHEALLSEWGESIVPLDYAYDI